MPETPNALDSRVQNPHRERRPAREQVHQALTLLGVPAAPKLIRAVHNVFFAGDLAPARLTSLRRHEERSYRSLPNARSYYLCPALTADRLSPARALLTVSTWPLRQRVVGPLSSRVDYLYAAIRVADLVGALAALNKPPEQSSSASASERLLWRFAVNIPGALAAAPQTPGGDRRQAILEPRLVRRAAQAELDAHAGADRAGRAATAQLARAQLSDVEQLFGRH
jgi:hypothetical protein